MKENVEKERGKMKKHRRKKGTVFIVLGVLMIGAALALVCYNRWDANRADRAAQTAVTQLLEKIPQNTDLYKTDTTATEGEIPAIDLDGDKYIGLLEVPSIDLTLPVLGEWSYDNLRISPCRYSGSVYEDNLVIAGHNYSRHFSPLKWLATGTEIKFYDVEGNVYKYVVTQIETLKPTEIDRMIEDSDDWDLTLFTCTTGGRSRCTLRCVRVED
jgi:sortase A